MRIIRASILVTWLSVGLARDDTLLVCDDGPRQQVLVYDVSGEKPKRIRLHGQKGGLGAGVPGKMSADKFFSLRGTGTDKAGNLSVSMSLGKGPNGSLTLRSLSPKGQLRWELHSTSLRGHPGIRSVRGWQGGVRALVCSTSISLARSRDRSGPCGR